MNFSRRGFGQNFLLYLKTKPILKLHANVSKKCPKLIQHQRAEFDTFKLNLDYPLVRK
jgi:hypothetical protein